MEVTKLDAHTKNADGVALSGTCEFSDGKEWEWFRSTHGKTLHFTIDTGVPSQWATGNFRRVISPRKRVAALKAALRDVGQTDYN